MALIWHPDFCPSGSPSCIFDVTNGWDNATPIRYCRHHQSLKDGGLTDAQVFAAVLQSSRVKEAARWAVKLELIALGDMTEANPGVLYTVGQDGNFTIDTGKTGLELTTIQTAVSTALVAVTQPIGTSTVTVN